MFLPLQRLSWWTAPWLHVLCQLFSMALTDSYGHSISTPLAASSPGRHSLGVVPPDEQAALLQVGSQNTFEEGRVNEWEVGIPDLWLRRPLMSFLFRSENQEILAVGISWNKMRGRKLKTIPFRQVSWLGNAQKEGVLKILMMKRKYFDEYLSFV